MPVQFWSMISQPIEPTLYLQLHSEIVEKIQI